MSTILKALRRLEEEKAATEEPRPLREQIASAPREAPRSRSSGWLAAAIALVLGVGAGGSVIWWMFGGASQPKQIAAASPMAAAPAPAAPVPAAVVPAPVARAPQGGPPDQAFESDVQIVNRPDALPRLADSQPVQPSPEPKPGSHRPVESSAAAMRARQAALAEHAAAERARQGLIPAIGAPSPPTPAEPVPAADTRDDASPAVASAPAPAPQSGEPQPSPAPTQVAAKSAPPKAAVKPAPPKPPRVPAVAPPAPAPAPAAPQIEVTVERTQWHPIAGRRIAWLRVPGEPDARRVVEGDVVSGLLVSAIEPSGVVFDRDGEKIRRGLGNK